MLHPSRQIVGSLALLAVIGLVLGVTTDVGLFGWIGAALIALYLCAAGAASRGRRPGSAGRSA